jgi:hypothetical protein
MRTGSRIVFSGRDERHVLASQEGVLQELERQGYVAEPHSAVSPSGMICRHPAAPDLLVCDDGRIELLRSQPNAQNLLLSQPLKRIHRGRTLLILALLCGATFLGLLVVAMIVG